MAIKIVTDSTSDLPAGLAKQMDISVVPLNVHFGQEMFQDGVTLSSDEFFQRLASAKELPRTSQPAPGAFVEVYQRLITEGHQVVSVHISEKLSGTLNSARQAKETLGDAPVHIVDSEQAAIGLGLVALAAAKKASSGAGLQDVITATRDAAGQAQVFGILETLEYLQRGGRIGKVRAMIGSLLHMRPIVTVREGVAQSAGTVRSRAQAMQFLMNIVQERAPLLQAAVVYSTTTDETEELVEKVKPFVQDGNVIRAQFGPVLGVYVGTGAWGLAVQSEKKDSLA